MIFLLDLEDTYIYLMFLRNNLDSLYKIELAVDTLKNKKKLYRYEIEFTKKPSQVDLTNIIEKMLAFN